MAKYEPWKERPTEECWNKLKKSIGWPEGTTDVTTPPMFGWIIDQLRIKYSIYLSAFPHNHTTSNGAETSLSFRFLGSLGKIGDSGGLEKEYTFSDTMFYVTVRRLMEKAAEWVEEEDKKTTRRK